MLKVGELVEYLKTLDQNATIVYGEQNGAMLGEGYFQPMTKQMLPMCIRTVKSDKEKLRGMYVQERMTCEEREEYQRKYEATVAKDYKYVDDDDIIVTI